MCETWYTVGYMKDVLATPFFLTVIYLSLRIKDLSAHRYGIARVFTCAFFVDFMFSVVPSLHNEPLTGDGHWGLGVTLLAGVGMITSIAADFWHQQHQQMLNKHPHL